MLISFGGEQRFPDKITPYSPPPVKAVEVEEVEEKTPAELLADANGIQKSNAMQNAKIASFAAAALLAYGVTAGDHDSVALMSSFALAGLAGYQVVWGVAPALREFTHSYHTCENLTIVEINSDASLLSFKNRFSINGSH